MTENKKDVRVSAQDVSAFVGGLAAVMMDFVSGIDVSEGDNYEYVRDVMRGIDNVVMDALDANEGQRKHNEETTNRILVELFTRATNKKVKH